MTRPIRNAVVVVSVLAALVLAVQIVAWLIVKTEWAREGVETGLGDALGMEVEIGQPLQLGLLPGVNVTLTDLEVSTQEQVVATVGRANARLAMLSLLTGTVRPLELHLERPVLSVERYGPGVFNVYPSEPRPELDDLSLRQFQASDARVTYADQASELEFRFEQCDLDLRNIRHAGGMVEQVLATLAAEGELKCGTVSQDAYTATDMSAQVHVKDGVFDLEPVSATIFEGQASGRFEADLSSDTPLFSLQGSISGLDFGALMVMLEPDQSSTGTLALELALDARGTTWQDIRNSVAGTISLRSGVLVLDGYDLDEELDNYADTQRFNLVDVGAVFLGGPLGLAVTRGYSFSDLLRGSGGSTTIDRMVSEWTVEGGVAQARDVAFRTPENRLALAGALDVGNYRFDDMRVAVIDSDGCAVVEQKITGPFREPEIEQPNFLVAAAGPLLDLVKSGVQKVTGSDCEVFYTGSIAHP
ncbi:MAG: AsmA family protein [Longimicrobiales bacterium]|nr:AsmA family protein [Longimicrobiales bacterium]